MMKLLKNNRAQAMLSEYGTLLLLVVAAIVAMTIYFKRAIQARVYDANRFMVQQVANNAGANLAGNIYYQYEPYYTNSETTASSSTNRESRLLGGGSTGIFEKDVNETRSISSTSETLPPRDTSLTLP